MAIPALHRLLSPEHHSDLITIDSGSVDRPHIREPFIDNAVSHVVNQITSATDPARAIAASARGQALTDDAIFDLALQLIRTATEDDRTAGQ